MLYLVFCIIFYSTKKTPTHRNRHVARYCILYHTILHHIILYCTLLYSTVLYCTPQKRTPTICRNSHMVFIRLRTKPALYQPKRNLDTFEGSQFIETALWHTIYYTMLYYAIFCSTVLHCIILRHTILYCTILYYTIFHTTLQQGPAIYRKQPYSTLYILPYYSTLLYYVISYSTPNLQKAGSNHVMDPYII